MEKRDWFWLFVLASLMVVCFYGGKLGYGQMIIYPELGPWQFFSSIGLFFSVCLF